MAGAAAFGPGGLVVAVEVQGEGADELSVDEHVRGGAGDGHERWLVLPFDPDVDLETRRVDDPARRDGAAVGLRRPAWVLEGSRRGLGGRVGREACSGGDATDALVGSCEVVEVAERVETGLKFGEVRCEGLAA